MLQRLARKFFRPRDGHQLAAREAGHEPAVGGPRLGSRIIGVCTSRRTVRARHGARLVELDALTGLDARRRGDALQGLGNRRGDVIDMHARQLRRERDRELRDLLELDLVTGDVMTTC